jgi:outer membrane protein assembly factor BamB
MTQSVMRRILLFLVLLLLSATVPVMGESFTIQPGGDLSLPAPGTNGTHTPHIQFADNGQLTILVYSNDPAIFRYDRNGSFLGKDTVSAEETPWISSASITPGGKNFVVTQLVPACCHGSVTNSSSNKVIFFDRSGMQLWDYPTYNPPLVSAVSGNNHDIIVGTDNGRIICLDINGSLRWVTPVDVPIVSLTTSRDGATVVATGKGNDYFATLYSKPQSPDDFFVLDSNGTVLRKNSFGGLDTVAINDDGAVIAVTGGHAGSLRVFNRSGTRTAERSLTGNPSALAMSGDGDLIVAGSSDGRVSAFDRKASPLWNISAGSGSSSIAVTGNGSMVVLGNNQTFGVYTRQGELLGTYPVNGRILSIKSSANGQSLVVMTEDRVIFFAAEVSQPATGYSEVSATPVLRSSQPIPVTSKKSPENSFVPILALCLCAVIVAFFWRS